MEIVMTRDEERKLRRKMRKVIRRAKNILAIGAVIGAFIIVGHIESHYSVEARVVDLNEYTYTVIDADGYDWTFEDDRLFPVGTKVKMKFHNNVTKTRADDQLVKVSPIK